MSKVRDSIEDLRSIATVDDAQTYTADQSHADNVKAKFGASDDLQIYHSGTHSYIKDTGTGNLNIQASASINILNADSSDYMARFNDNGAVQLFHDGSQKLATTSTGVDVTGEITADGLALGDSQKATFGASDDLQIYHDGLNSYIRDEGTGRLIIQASDGILLQSHTAEYYFQGIKDGAAKIYHNNAEKLVTTSTGVDVTGTLSADGLTVEGDQILIDSPAQAFLKVDRGSADNHYALTRYYTAGTEEWRTGTYNDDSSTFFIGGPATKNISITQGGDISFFEDQGITPKFFWDASAESLGIGNSSPSSALDVSGTVTADNVTATYGGSAGIDSRIVAANTGNGGAGRGVAISLKPAGSGNSVEAVRLVGLQETAATTANNASFAVQVANSSGTLTERLRIDSSGNVLVGGTSAYAVDAVTLAGSGLVYSSRTSNQSGQFDRRTTDGEIIRFTKDGTTVGSIGVNSTTPYMSGNLGGFRLTSSGGAGVMIPTDTSGNSSDADNDLGMSGTRWRDLHLSGTAKVGVISVGSSSDSLYLGGGTTTPSQSWLESTVLTGFKVAGSERMRIDSSGNVGIGTSSPSGYYTGADNLVVAQASGQGGITIATANNTSGALYFADGTSGDAEYRGGVGYNHSTDSLFLVSGGSTKAYIDSSGNVGIGTSSPNERLSVVSEEDTTPVDNGFSIYRSVGDDKVTINAQGGAAKFIADGGSTDIPTIFYRYSGTTLSESMRISSTGNVGIGTSSPAAPLTVSGDTTQVRLENTATGGRNWGLRTFGSALGIYDHTAGAFRQYIDSSGNVGIGTVSPTELLTVNGSIALQYNSSDRVKLSYTNAQGSFVINNTTAGYTSFENNGSERMRIDSSGNLLVGTTTAGYTYQGGFSVNPSGASYFTVAHPNGAGSGNSYALFTYNAGIIGSITQSGTNAISFNTASDYRLKELDVPMTGATERVKALRPINFAWKADGSRVDGFFAHELAEVVPEAATGTKDAMMDEEYEVTPAVVDAEGVETTAAVMGTRSVPDYQGIDQSKLVPLLTATIQELIARIEILESGV